MSEPTRAPLRPDQHQIGDAGVRAFQAALPDQWVAVRADPDYGWDYIVTLTKASGEVEDEFFAQVKGSTAISYSADNSFISQELEVPTIEWLDRRPMPVMIAVCDVANPERPVFWVWLRDALDELSPRNRTWSDQESATIRVPTSNLLASTAQAVEASVRRWHQERRLSKAITDVLVSPPLRTTFLAEADVRKLDPAYVRSAVLQDLGVSSSALNVPVDGPLSNALERIAALLNVHQDAEAGRLLDGITQAVATASDVLRASYENALGIIALHDLNAAEAGRRFGEAARLCPNEPKYAANVLSVEELVAINAKRPLDDSWTARLDRVLDANPAFAPALALKVRALARQGAWEDAELVVRGANSRSPADQQRLALALADIAIAHQNYDLALRLADSVKDTAGAFQADCHAVLGYAYFRKSLRQHSLAGDEVRLEGTGPASMDLSLLDKAARAYDQACRTFASLSYPLSSEDAFVNAATVLSLNQQADVAQHHINGFLQRHPSSNQMQAAMAMVLTYLSDARAASTFAATAFEGTRSSHNFKNLLLTLLRVEAFEELLERVRDRNNDGFADEAEEVLALELSAIAHSAIGESDSANGCLTRLRRMNRHAEAAGAEALIVLPVDPVGAASIARQALEVTPGSALLLTVLFRCLLPVREATAAEIERVVAEISQIRQLDADELKAMSRVYQLTRQLERADELLARARARFPQEYELLVLHAEVMYELGRDEAAFVALQDFLKRGRRSYSVYRNLGHLGWITGRTQEAIRLFEMALRKADDESEKAELHCQLFELYRRSEVDGKTRLRHVHAYGALAEPLPENEARYLTMFLSTGVSASETEDSEVQGWIAEFRRRLAAFSNQHPRFHSLTTIRMPTGVSEEDQLRELLSEVMALTLPAQIARGRAEMKIRDGAWPLSTRAQRLQAGSIFQYWDRCIASTEREHAVHIFSSPLQIAQEAGAVRTDAGVCIDVTAMLTLEMLGLLQEVVHVFPFLVMTASTLESIDRVDGATSAPHPKAATLRAWFTAHRERIRLRSYRGARPASRLAPSIVILPEPIEVGDLIGDGCGETLALAKDLGLALYSDETTVRQWASEKGIGVSAFSTIALLRHLREKDRLSLEHETRMLATMARNNFRYLPLETRHFREAIRQFVGECDNPSSDALRHHPVSGPFLAHFGDAGVTDQSLMSVGTQLIVSLIKDRDVPDSVIVTVLETISFRLSQRVQQSLLVAVERDKHYRRLAIWWTELLYVTGEDDPSCVGRCWSVIQSSAATLLKLDEQMFNRMFEEWMPECMYRIIRRRQSRDSAIERLVALPELLPETARGMWIGKFLKFGVQDRLFSIH